MKAEKILFQEIHQDIKSVVFMCGILILVFSSVFGGQMPENRFFPQEFPPKEFLFSVLAADEAYLIDISKQTGATTVYDAIRGTGRTILNGVEATFVPGVGGTYIDSSLDKMVVKKTFYYYKMHLGLGEGEVYLAPYIDSLGGDVTWDRKSNKAMLTMHGIKHEVQIGQKGFKVVNDYLVADKLKIKEMFGIEENTIAKNTIANQKDPADGNAKGESKKDRPGTIDSNNQNTSEEQAQKGYVYAVIGVGVAVILSVGVWFVRKKRQQEAQVGLMNLEPAIKGFEEGIKESIVKYGIEMDQNQTNENLDEAIERMGPKMAEYLSKAILIKDSQEREEIFAYAEHYLSYLSAGDSREKIVAKSKAFGHQFASKMIDEAERMGFSPSKERIAVVLFDIHSNSLG